MSKFMLVV